MPPIPDRGACHVTLRVRDDLPNLRDPECMRVIWHCFTQAKRRFGLRLVHFGVQRNHMHLIVEVSSREALMRGMRALSIRLARGLNRALGRRGPVLADRYHVQLLDNLARLRRCIAYVLNNERRHAYQHGGWLKARHYIDPCSSARYFDGWAVDGVRVTVAWPRGVSPPVARPKGWALDKGWRRHGLIELDEVPGKNAVDAQMRRRRDS